MAIKKLALEEPGLTPAQIADELRWRKRFKDRWPSPRTVERLVKEVRVPDNSGPWRFECASTEAQEVVFETLAGIATWTHGRTQGLSDDEGEMLSRLAHRTRTLDARTRWMLAQLYRLRRHRKAETADLDQYLAHQPWLDDAHQQDYAHKIELHEVQRPPALLYGDLEELTYGDMEDRDMAYADLEGDFSGPVG